MKRYNTLISLVIALIIIRLITGCQPADRNYMDERNRLFNNGWKFMRDSLSPGAELPEYNDSDWQVVDLPHDWSIADLPGNDGPDQIGPFSKSSRGATSTGYVQGGTAWYRKHFTLDKEDTRKTAILYFDGVYMEADVWVNGKPAGKHVYGYTPFWFDITSLLNKAGRENVVAMRVNNTGRNSRWYSGSGIYRNVHLMMVQPVHIAVWGMQITTPVIATDSAVIMIKATINNESGQAATGKVRFIINDPDGKQVAAGGDSFTIPVNGTTILNQSMKISSPALWSPSTPDLYQAEAIVEVDGKLTDQYLQPFGVRSVEVSVEKGLILNGSPVELKGGCMHHDNGLLGSAAFERAEERRVEIMKANGFNAIRTSHNPPSEVFLDACDRLGMLVIDETFDMWERPKNPNDYHRFFREWWKKDVEAMILRDRNHPSIIFWSIGNEINERADTSGMRIAKSMISHIRQYDTTRFFTNAICEFWDIPGKPWDATAPAFEPLTVGGYNYQFLKYETDHDKFPARIMMGTESVPMDAFGNWQMVEKHPYVIGDFVWTGMDYLGETGIGHTQYFSPGQQDAFAMTWPWFNAWCGDIDITGNKKPQMFYRDVIWGNSPLEINVHAPVPEGKTEKISYWGWYDEWPSWNWIGHEDKPLRISVYTRADSVRLELNGRVVGLKEVSEATKLTASFDVPYEPGELRATAIEHGKEIAVKVLSTSGTPAGVRLTADRNPIKANRNDLCYISIEIIDEFGQLVDDASKQVSLSIAGNGELIGSGNACPFDMESIGKPVIKTFRGRALAIVRPSGKPGTITFTAGCEGMKDEVIEIQTYR